MTKGSNYLHYSYSHNVSWICTPMRTNILPRYSNYQSNKRNSMYVLLLLNWTWRGYSINNATLNRFFSLHFILPFVILFFINDNNIHVGIVASRSAPVGHDQFIDIAGKSDKDLGKILPLRRALLPFIKYRQVTNTVRSRNVSDIITHCRESTR